MTLNKNIFICWFQGQKHLNTHPKSTIFNENIKNWQLLNPSWKLHLISNKELRNACKKFSKKCLQLYDSFNLLHLKVDLGRYVLLYLYGGIYVDMDMYVLRGLETSPIINNLIKLSSQKHILALSSLNLDIHESILFIGKYRVLNNAMMLSTKFHPLLSLMIKTIIKTSTKNTYSNSYDIIQNITGPVFINKYFSKFINISSNPFFIEIFPHSIFEPSPAYGNSDIRDNTIAIHKMELSWIPLYLKNFISFYYKIKPYLFFTITFIIYYLYSNYT
jgi:mannosyltransferase OCH1-like enzyme